MSTLVPFDRNTLPANGRKGRSKVADRSTLVGDLAASHGVSIDRAQMLIDRFGIERGALDAAALGLQEWKS